MQLCLQFALDFADASGSGAPFLFLERRPIGSDLKLCQAFLRRCVACKFILLPVANCHDMLYAANMFLWWCQTKPGKPKSWPCASWTGNKWSWACLCVRAFVFLYVAKACYGPSSFWARWWLGNPVSEAEQSWRRNPTSCQEPTGVQGHLRICAKKMAKGISSTAIAHIDNLFPAGAATPRRRKKPWWGPRLPAKSLLLQLQWTFTSPLFPVHGPLPSEDHAPAKSKSETRMIKQMPSMPWTVFSVPFALSFQGCTYQDLMPKALTEPEGSVITSERLIAY